MADNDKRIRTRGEAVLLTLSGIGVLGVTPFAIYRAIQGQWLGAAVDAAIVAIVIGVFAYVWRTGKVRIPGLIVTLCYTAVVIAVNYISGPSLFIWAYPTMAAAYFLVRPNEGVVINVVAILGLLPVLVDSMSLLQITGVLITLVLNNSFAYLYARFSLKYQEALSQLASEDALTGVGNRASFTQHMKRVMAESKRVDTAFYLLLFDVDHFKQINDSYGHATGDMVLQNIAGLCKNSSRDVDGIYRLGGEEFAIVAMGIDFEGAVFFADKIRRRIGEADMLEGRHVTVSVGVACLSPDDTAESLMSRADTAMYLAKRQGRDRVCSERHLPAADML